MDDGANSTGNAVDDSTDARPACTEPDAKGAAMLFTSRAQAQNVRRPVPKRTVVTREEFNSDKYKMNYPNRGKALIINNKNFHPSLRLGERKGTDKDAAAMFARLQELEFDVKVEYDLTKQSIHKFLDGVALEDHNDNDCFVCVILSHGEEGIVYGTDAEVEIKQLFEYFKGNNCPSLIGKPKIFIIQACRGQKFDDGADETVADAVGDMEVEEEIYIKKIPAEADFLVVYSVVPGFYSWRNSTNGSWFIQALSSAMTENAAKKPEEAKLDFLRLLTRVNRKVAYNFESNTTDPRMRDKKQIPCITSMLTKEIFFPPK